MDGSKSDKKEKCNSSHVQKSQSESPNKASNQRFSRASINEKEEKNEDKDEMTEKSTGKKPSSKQGMKLIAVPSFKKTKNMNSNANDKDTKANQAASSKKIAKEETPEKEKAVKANPGHEEELPRKAAFNQASTKDDKVAAESQSPGSGDNNALEFVSVTMEALALGASGAYVAATSMFDDDDGNKKEGIDSSSLSRLKKEKAKQNVKKMWSLPIASSVSRDCSHSEKSMSKLSDETKAKNSERKATGFEVSEEQSLNVRKKGENPSSKTKTERKKRLFALPSHSKGANGKMDGLKKRDKKEESDPSHVPSSQSKLSNKTSNQRAFRASINEKEEKNEKIEKSTGKKPRSKQGMKLIAVPTLKKMTKSTETDNANSNTKDKDIQANLKNHQEVSCQDTVTETSTRDGDIAAKAQSNVGQSKNSFAFASATMAALALGASGAYVAATSMFDDDKGKNKEDTHSSSKSEMKNSSKATEKKNSLKEGMKSIGVPTFQKTKSAEAKGEELGAKDNALFGGVDLSWISMLEEIQEDDSNGKEGSESESIYTDYSRQLSNKESYSDASETMFFWDGMDEGSSCTEGMDSTTIASSPSGVLLRRRNNTRNEFDEAIATPKNAGGNSKRRRGIFKLRKGLQLSMAKRASSKDGADDDIHKYHDVSVPESSDSSSDDGDASLEIFVWGELGKKAASFQSNNSAELNENDAKVSTLSNKRRLGLKAVRTPDSQKHNEKKMTANKKKMAATLPWINRKIRKEKQDKPLESTKSGEASHPQSDVINEKTGSSVKSAYSEEEKAFGSELPNIFSLFSTSTDDMNLTLNANENQLSDSASQTSSSHIDQYSSHGSIISEYTESNASKETVYTQGWSLNDTRRSSHDTKRGKGKRFTLVKKMLRRRQDKGNELDETTQSKKERRSKYDDKDPIDEESDVLEVVGKMTANLFDKMRSD